MKRYRKFWLLLGLSCCLLQDAPAAQLQFQYLPGTKYRFLGRIYQEVYVDGELSHIAETLNKVAIEVTGLQGKLGEVAMTFQVSEKLQDGGPLYLRREETFHSRFRRDVTGKYVSAPEYLMPSVRDVPRFPERDLKPGDTWSATGEEYQDFRPWGLSRPVSVPMEVNYIYLREEQREEERIAVLKIYYLAEGYFDKYLQMAPGIPVEIVSYSNRILYWNISRGRVEGYEDDFNVRFIYVNGQVQQFKGRVEAEVYETPVMDKEKLARELTEIIGKEQLTDVMVISEPDGVTIRLENIQFPPDSDLLTPAEKNKLAKIADILRHYPAWDLFVGGHTALAGTEAGRQTLSKQRARVVGEFLVKAGVVKDVQLTYQGFGASQPLADNATAEGMARNRRVEIKLMEN